MKKAKINWWAIGLELLVVFLGVTAGFMLQNYQENRSERDLESKYLDGFKTDLRANIESLNSHFREDSTWIVGHNYAIRQIESKELSEDSANTLFRSMASISRFSPQIVTYENITNSGNLGLIKDYDIRNAIVQYHMELSEHNILEEYYQDYHQMQLLPFFILNYDVFSQKWSSDNIYKGIEFHNHFGAVFSFKQQCANGYHSLLQTSEALLARLEE